MILWTWATCLQALLLLDILHLHPTAHNYASLVCVWGGGARERYKGWYHAALYTFVTYHPPRGWMLTKVLPRVGIMKGL